MRTLPATLLLLPLLVGCTPTAWMTLSDNVNRGVVLGETKDADGTERRWRIYPGNQRNPRIDVTATTVREAPRIGVTVTSVSRHRAEREGIEPFRGVRLTRVSSGEPAAIAGLAAGDVVLEVAGDPVNSSEQFADLIAAHGVPGEDLPVTALVYREDGRRLDKPRKVELTLAPRAVTVRDAQTDSIPLEASRGIQRYSGMQVVSLPPEVSRPVYGQDQEAVVVSGVVTGSSAYDAGLRTGDRVISCDGASVASLDDLRAAVYHRVTRRYGDAPLHDLLTSDLGAPREGDVQLVVDGPLGRHTATLKVRDGEKDSSRVHVPIVMDYRTRANRTDFEFLKFILQFGWDYTNQKQPSATRAPATYSKLSILPFGMFEFESGPSSSKTTLFWFITFRSD